MTGKRLTRRFYRRDPVTVAKALLGQILVRRLDDGQELSGRIVETEAYLGIPDKASHSYGGRRTKRNESMYLDGGHAYVYFVYGMHWCFNVVSERNDIPSAVLIRALEPMQGIDEMRRRRSVDRASPSRLKNAELCSGPAKLTQALGIGPQLDGLDLASSQEVYLCRGSSAPNTIEETSRVGVKYAEEWKEAPLRFHVSGHLHVSRPSR